MASRLGMLKSAANSGAFGIARWVSAAAISSPLDISIQRVITSPPLVLPEHDSTFDSDNSYSLGFPGISFGGSMELMAVPKKKVSPHKRGIRNGPKALKPTPVIVRCRDERMFEGLLYNVSFRLVVLERLFLMETEDYIWIMRNMLSIE